jgi:putative membrane protein
VANWVNDWNTPLEEVFEKLGRKQDVEVSLLAFKTGNKMKAVIVVPHFHPGPFKNVGSSQIPQMIQKALEKKLKCVVSVPHGLFGHEFDLSSQLQNQKVINKILQSVDFPVFNSETTHFVYAKRDAATADCQIFGDCALIMLTMAPETIEDLPPELGSAVFDEARKHGLLSAIVVNTHNSINGYFNPDKASSLLKDATLSAIQKALSCERFPFKVGAAKVVPKEFGVTEGMALGGITVIVIEAVDQKTAYVTIDGNNMMSGLRQKILSALRDFAVDAGEVFTTDTHAVNGIVLTPRGYHPVGEVMEHNKLVDYIRQAVSNALDNMEFGEAAWSTLTVHGVKVIGREQIDAISLVAEKAAEKAKRTAVSLFSAVSLLLTIMVAAF